MKFFDFIKKFFWFTLKETYSFFLKLTLLIILIFIIGFSTVAILDSKLNGEKVKKNNDYVLFNVSDVVEDKVIGSDFLSDKKDISYMDILQSLDAIKNDNSIKGVILSLDNINLSSSKIEELTKKFLEIKQNNKKIYAFGAYITNANYKLASIADEIVAVPSASASVNLTGYNYSDIYMKGLLDKLGVDMEVVRILWRKLCF